MSKDKGGPAFPATEAHGLNSGLPGMTLRDYFAAKAFPAVYSVAMKEAGEGSGLFQHDDWPVGLALDAYRMADAMLQAREAT